MKKILMSTALVLSLSSFAYSQEAADKECLNFMSSMDTLLKHPKVKDAPGVPTQESWAATKAQIVDAAKKNPAGIEAKCKELSNSIQPMLKVIKSMPK